MALEWSDEVDDIIGADQVVAFGYVTPARGVVLTPMTNFGIRDRAAGTMTPINSSVAMWRKLDRLRENPRIAIAYHTRTHSGVDRPEYVLVQGDAVLTSMHDRTWLERHRDHWERFGGPRDVGPLWEAWLRPYHWRVGIGIDVERVLVWPDLACRAPMQTRGTDPHGDRAEPQRPPAKGVEPRIPHRRAARFVTRRPNRLLSWVGADGYPVIVPVEVVGVDERGPILRTEAEAVPPGGRKAGLLAHSFARYTYGQHLRKYTGWMWTDGDRIGYAPHTVAGYHIPSSRTAYRLAAGYGTWRGNLQGRRAGVVPSPASP